MFSFERHGDDKTRWDSTNLDLTLSFQNSCREDERVVLRFFIWMAARGQSILFLLGLCHYFDNCKGSKVSAIFNFSFCFNFSFQLSVFNFSFHSEADIAAPRHARREVRRYCSCVEATAVVDTLLRRSQCVERWR